MSEFTIRYTVGGGVTPYTATLSGSTELNINVHNEDGTFEFNSIDDGLYNLNVVDSVNGEFSTQLQVGITYTGNGETEGLGENTI